MSIPIALQLYTVRDNTAKDFPGTLKKVAEIGYQGVEFAGFGDVPAPEMKSVLDSLGLKAVGSHTSMELLQNKFDETAEYNLAIGNENIVCPWHAFESRDDYLKAAQFFNETGEKCRQRGLKFGYHNHDGEFNVYNGEYGLDILFNETKPENMFAEIDTCWVFFAGVDPAGYIRKYKGRCPLIHLKDLKNKTEKVFAEVGNGVVDVKSVIKASIDAGAKWFVVEQDSCSIPTLESARISYENVRKLL